MAAGSKAASPTASSLGGDLGSGWAAGSGVQGSQATSAPGLLSRPSASGPSSSEPWAATDPLVHGALWWSEAALALPLDCPRSLEFPPHFPSPRLCGRPHVVPVWDREARALAEGVVSGREK